MSAGSITAALAAVLLVLLAVVATPAHAQTPNRVYRLGHLSPSALGEQISREEFSKRIVDDAGFADRWGDLGPVYGQQWRAWATVDGRCIDQLSNAVDLLRRDPDSRRIVVSALKPTVAFLL